jgi:hypothetical protein
MAAGTDWLPQAGWQQSQISVTRGSTEPGPESRFQCRWQAARRGPASTGLGFRAAGALPAGRGPAAAFKLQEDEFE